MFDVFDFVNNSLFLEAFGDEFVAGPNVDTIFIGIANAKSVKLFGIFFDIVAVFVEGVDKTDFVFIFLK